jgi:hypothetical protein
MPGQVPGPREATGKNKLTVMALDVLKFNGSLQQVRAVMLTGVTGVDIFGIAVAWHFGKFKSSSNVPFEEDISSHSKKIYTYLFKNASLSSKLTSSSCQTINYTSARSS